MEGGPCGPLSFYGCQRGCHGPGCGLILPQRPQNRVRKGAGSGGRSGDGLLQLPWTRDTPHTVLEAQKRQGCPGTRLLLPDWGPCPVLVTGLGPGVWASMSSLWSVLGSFRPQYCHDPSPFLFRSSLSRIRRRPLPMGAALATKAGISRPAPAGTWCGYRCSQTQPAAFMLIPPFR